MTVVVALGTQKANKAPDVILEHLTNTGSKRRHGRAILRKEMFHRKDFDLNLLIIDTIMRPAKTVYIDQTKINRRSKGIVTGFNITITTKSVDYDYTCEVRA